MNILILGGTGAIGRALIDLLKSTSWNVLVTSRNVRENENNIRYIKGNAHEGEFLKQCLENRALECYCRFYGIFYKRIF